MKIRAKHLHLQNLYCLLLIQYNKTFTQILPQLLRNVANFLQMHYITKDAVNWKVIAVTFTPHHHFLL